MHDDQAFFRLLSGPARVIAALIFLPKHFRVDFAAARLDQSTMLRAFDISYERIGNPRAG